MDRLRDLWSYTDLLPNRRDWYGNSAQDWILALLIALAVFLVLRLIKSLVLRRAQALSRRPNFEWAAAVANLTERTKLWFLIIVSLYFGSLALDFRQMTDVSNVFRETNIPDIIRAVVIITLLIQAAIWGNALLNYSVERYSKQRMSVDAASVTTIAALGFLGKVALWTVVVLLAMENVGIEVTALLAGLGLGGVAVALAAQNILGDLFASFSIVLDKPFVLGDFIVVGQDIGTVEHIGLKTTRVRSLSGEQLVFANNDLLQSRIRNMKRMAERRVVFSLGVTYQTPYQKVAAIPGMIREAIEKQPQTRFDRAHFQKYGDFALVFEAVYFVLAADYNIYMDTHQAVNLELYERFAREGIDFAYPTQTLFINQIADASP